MCTSQCNRCTLLWISQCMCLHSYCEEGAPALVYDWYCFDSHHPGLSVLQYVRALKNFRAEQPHQHAIYYTALIMSETMWTKEELLEATEGRLFNSTTLLCKSNPHALGHFYLGLECLVSYGEIVGMY